MTKQETQEFVDVLTGKLKLKLTVKETPTSQFVDRLVAANRRDHARTTEGQHRAALIRGC